MTGKLLRYIGAADILGEIAKGDSFYWRVHPAIQADGKKGITIDYSRVVCHPKWNTEIVNDGGFVK